MPKKKISWFSQLNFSPVSPSSKTSLATINFANRYGANVYLHSPNTNTELPYEIEVLYDNLPTVNQRISDENIGYCDENDINQILNEISRL